MQDENYDYMQLDFVDLDAPPPITRRDFFKFAAGGIVVYFAAGELTLAQEGGRRGFRPQLPDDFNAFLLIGENGRVSCFTGKIEMGQGIITSLAQMLADELDVPVASVDMVMGDTDLCPWDMGTFGSMSTRLRPSVAGGGGGGARRAPATGRGGVAGSRLTIEDGPGCGGGLAST
ncbi:molybdopterin-dependent oxidoreductase [bacterium]|nr:molybdopterin-dependent oxidoreductase [bacterium]